MNTRTVAALFATVALAFTSGCVAASAEGEGENVGESSEALSGASNPAVAAASCQAKGWVWNSTSETCTDPYAEAKSECSTVKGTWDTTTHLCEVTCLEKTPPSGYECAPAAPAMNQEVCETSYDGVWTSGICRVSCLNGKAAPQGTLCATGSAPPAPTSPTYGGPVGSIGTAPGGDPSGDPSGDPDGTSWIPTGDCQYIGSCLGGT